MLNINTQMCQIELSSGMVDRVGGVIECIATKFGCAKLIAIASNKTTETKKNKKHNPKRANY